MASRVKLVTRLGLLGPAQPMWAELDPAQKKNNNNNNNKIEK
jgi:hypothetical protein